MTDWQGFREEEAAVRQKNITIEGNCPANRRFFLILNILTVIPSGARDLMGPFEIKMKSGIENQGI
jgi:hypothetical protein